MSEYRVKTACTLDPNTCTGVCLGGRQWTKLALQVGRPRKAGQTIP